MLLGTYFCRASLTLRDLVCWIWLASTRLTLAGTFSGSMPEPAIGVVGYTTSLGMVRAIRVAFWARPGLGLGVVPVNTRGGNVWAPGAPAPGASWARAQS